MERIPTPLSKSAALLQRISITPEQPVRHLLGGLALVTVGLALLRHETPVTLGAIEADAMREGCGARMFRNGRLRVDDGCERITSS